IDVLPFAVRRHRAGAPETNAAPIAAKVASTIHPAWVENVLIAFGYGKFEIDCAANYFVRRRLVHASLDISARVNSGHMSGVVNESRVVDRRVKDPDPGVVKRSVRTVASGLDRGDVALALRLGNNRKAILEQFALIENRLRHGPHVSHFVRREQQRNLVDRFDGCEAPTAT